VQEKMLGRGAKKIANKGRLDVLLPCEGTEGDY